MFAKNPGIIPHVLIGSVPSSNRRAGVEHNDLVDG